MELPSPSLSQASFAAAILATAVGSYVALSPPNPSHEPTAAPNPSDKLTATPKEKKKNRKPTTNNPPPTMRRPTTPPPNDTHHDTIRALTSSAATKACFAPLGLLSLHTAALACYFPSCPPARLIGYVPNSPNGINTDMISWSTASAVPMAVILCAGLPLRLGPYTALGRNFTFGLARPDRLTTTGIYKYVQHPSYVGLILTLMGNAALLCRPDGVLTCWVPPRWMEGILRWKVVPAVLGAQFVMGLWMLWKRTLEEEDMLRKAFGKEWEEWHGKTARFIPGVF